MTPTEGWMSLIQALGEAGPPSHLHNLEWKLPKPRGHWELPQVSTSQLLPPKPLAHSVHTPCLRAPTPAVPRAPPASRSYIDEGRMLKGEGRVYLTVRAEATCGKPRADQD